MQAHHLAIAHPRANRPARTLRATELPELLRVARQLRDARRAGVPLDPLLGANIAVIHRQHADVSAQALHRAASELGARPVHLACMAIDTDSEEKIRAIARMLGQLYDAVDCGNVAEPLLRAIERHAGIPVFDCLGSDQHAARVLADLLAMEDSSGKPLSSLSIGYVSNDDQRHQQRHHVLMRAAQQTGMALIDIRLCHDPVCARQHGPSSQVDFIIDARGSTRWSLLDQTGAGIESLRADHHRFLMQSVMITALT